MVEVHGLILVVVVMAVAWSMQQAGLAKKALELRHPPRACPACGRPKNACRCMHDA